MTVKAYIPEYEISELYLNIGKSGKIYRTQLQQIQYPINSHTLRSSDDRKIISRLLYAVRRGWVSVIDSVAWEF
ncbi:hypothetical protein QUA13_21830 [Microcoleus sp. S28C3]|uniref:hypothetical protein n=1 Tax=Microcoleus sp. S28C3 TaxID=3055414 RepID=UPI002FCE83B6